MVLGHDGIYTFMHYHKIEIIVIVTKFSPLAALEVVIVTTSNAAGDDFF